MIYKNIHDAYLGTLADVYDNPDFTESPRGQRTREKLNYQFSIANPTVEYIITKDLERNKVIESYSKKEFDIYESGTNLAVDFGNISKFWLKLANPDDTVNSAYGHLVFFKKSHGSPFETELVEYTPTTRAEIARNIEKDGKHYKEVPVMRTPYEWCLESLRRDKATRQAILRFSLPEHQWMGNKDQTCTLHGIFMIRDNKLNLSVNMRSNDLTLGLVYDLPWFISLMYKMQKDLADVYPDLEIGTYTHYVHSLHIYDRDEERILKMLGRK